MPAQAPDGSPPGDDFAAKLTAVWDERGVDISALEFVSGTAVAQTLERPITLVERIQTLPNLLEPGPETTTPQFRLGAVLGEGGMGVVRLAEQIALGREVAVKSLHGHADAESNAPQLLREARVTGALEHPNVVPVYALGRDADGRPLIVMKRIEGKSWQDILDDTDEETRKSGEYLREHVGILKQVCLAVKFAHSKGIVHRDLKPDNVMMGAFGEIYLVDWGIAVTAGPDPVAGLPRAQDVSAIEGTPAYLSPEMAAGDGEAIDERSDVYLLGAILHQIIVGQPPHGGRTLKMVLTNAFASEPAVYDDHVPKDLADICHRAMARFSEDRYPSAAVFAEAIDQFIRHRSSTLLSDEASKRLSSLQQLAPGAAPDDEERTQQLHVLFSECRFGFNQALKEWRANEAARLGLRQALTLMIDFELSRGAANAAASLLHGLDDVPAELAERVAAAVRSKRQEKVRLAKLEHDIDLGFGARTRQVVLISMSLTWGLGCFTAGALDRYHIVKVDPLRFGLFNAALLAILVVVAVLARRLVFAAANRRLALLSTTAFAGYAVLWSTLGWLKVDVAGAAILHALVGALVWSSAAIHVDRRWIPMPVIHLVAFVTLFWLPEYPFEILGISGTLGSLSTATKSASSGRNDGAADSLGS
jgi:serine/threonine protein kinase